ncbi:helix-turn-helix domain-containing protein [Pseudomonas huanghezhanensis]|uniref:helix-turn-helix domain-containing protein n=1 Tax=Pseudomonas huanghezhanensis TaxID=3002903 RepID=UPI0022858201|nr:helix-turn-helix transcriptional regulator [Pseudomonas sp. BSw22131]
MLEGRGKKQRAARITHREREVLQLVMQGFTNKDIAQHLGISNYTARDHVSALLRKTEVKNRAQLMACYLPAPRKTKNINNPLHVSDCIVEKVVDNAAGSAVNELII